MMVSYFNIQVAIGDVPHCDLQYSARTRKLLVRLEDSFTRWGMWHAGSYLNIFIFESDHRFILHV